MRKFQNLSFGSGPNQVESVLGVVFTHGPSWISGSGLLAQVEGGSESFSAVGRLFTGPYVGDDTGFGGVVVDILLSTLSL